MSVVEELFDVDSDGLPVLRVQLQPGAGKTVVSGRHGDAVKVRVAAPPEGGRANDACVKLLAEVFGVKANQIELTVGATSRAKRFRISGVDNDDFVRLLKIALDEAAPDRPAPPRGPGARP